MSGSVWFSKLDANSAYWQIPIRVEDRKKTAFISKYGLFEHVRMGFGLCGAPATYARAMNLVLRGLTWKVVLAFLDDIVVLGRNFDDHISNLKDALLRYREFGLKLKPKKCAFFQNEIEFLGRKVSGNSLAMSENDIEVVKQWPVPTDSKQVERFMGLANYHRGFIKNFSELAAPLYAVTGKKLFVWGSAQESAFNALKEALTSPPILALPKENDPFILDTDASNEAIGAVLIQVQNGQEKVVAYGSFGLTKEQRRYCVTRRELLAVVRFTRQFRHYLLGKPFTVRTDHSSLRWLMGFREPQGQLARWLEELSRYNMVLQHRAGRDHGNADALSRLVDQGQCREYRVGTRLDQLPCGGCTYCKRAQDNWGSFCEQVDEVVPLECMGVTGSAAGGKVVAGNPGSTVKMVAPLLGVHKDTKVATSSNSGKTVCSETELNKLSVCEVQPSHIRAWENVVDMIPWNQSGSNSGVEVVSVNLVSTQHPSSIAHKSENSKRAESVSVLPSELSSWGFSVKELCAAQKQDCDLKLILDWLKDGVVPESSVLFRASPAAKSYWLNKDQFQVICDVLYQKDPNREDLRLVIPKSLRGEAMRLSHSLPVTGHQGVARTKERVKEKFVWYGLGQEVRQFVSQCSVCNQNKKSDRHGKGAMLEYQAGAPMERVHIDFLGPLPKTAKGNEYVLMMVDQFTKWVECIPLPNQSAETTARAVVDSFFSRFGMPLEIFSDQGRNFESKLFSEVCKVVEIHKTRTTPYRPSANGQVERYNRTLMDAIRCFIGKAQNQWDVHLQQIAGALRSSVNRMTGFTANMLMLGREVNMPAHLMFPLPSGKKADPEDYAGQLVEKLKMAHETARKNMKSSSKRMKRNYDLRLLERSFQVGDKVYLLDTAATKGKCKKLCSPWKGPGIVIEKLSAVLFRVKLRNSVMVVNHDRIKPCRDGVLPQWINRWKPDDTGSKPVRGDDRVYFCVGNPGKTDS